jgi:hypothetical protein
MIFLAKITDSERLFAEHGLTGLVIFALISIILLLIRFSSTLIKEERIERRFTTEKHVGATDKLSEAISKLSESLKKDGN